jgi:hypothetical protein
MNTSDGAAAALASLATKRAAAALVESKYGAGKVVLTTTPEPEAYPGKRPKDKCPDCGSLVLNWYSPNSRDPGDVDPRADCTNCSWGY